MSDWEELNRDNTEEMCVPGPSPSPETSPEPLLLPELPKTRKPKSQLSIKERAASIGRGYRPSEWYEEEKPQIHPALLGPLEDFAGYSKFLKNSPNSIFEQTSNEEVGDNIDIEFIDPYPSSNEDGDCASYIQSDDETLEAAFNKHSLNKTEDPDSFGATSIDPQATPNFNNDEFPCLQDSNCGYKKKEHKLKKKEKTDIPDDNIEFQPRCTVIVSNVPVSKKEADIRVMEAYGNIKLVVFSEDGSSHKQALVEFEDRSDAELAAECFHNTQYFGNSPDYPISTKLFEEDEIDDNFDCGTFLSDISESEFTFDA